MNLATKIITRISLALLVVMTIWAAIFYFIIIDEVNDETDDALEDYSENIIKRALAGEKLPEANNGTNNSYYITEVSQKYAEETPWIMYFDELVFIEAKNETEPARVLKTIFRDKNSQYYELRVAIPSIEKDDLREAILFWIVILYFFLSLVVIVTNWWVLKRSLRPLYSMLKWLDNFRVDKKITEPKIETNVVEFKKLKEAIVRSAYRNIETYEQQKLFIGNASHELQTPLAVCRNRLEMLLDNPALNEEQMTEIFKVKQSLDSLIKLNKTLLLLTKIENNQFPEKREINANELIKRAVNLFSEVYENEKIKVDISEEAVFNVEMNEELATVLFNNLIKNAFVHNRENGKINVLLTAKSVSIANTGDKVALNPDEIFKRFYQGRKKENSSGLGLALVKTISNAYGLNIQYRFDKEMHIFTTSR